MKIGIINSFKKCINDMPLRNKLLCTFFILIVLPLFLFTTYAFIRINTVIQKQTFSAAQKTFEDTYLNIQTALNNASSIVNILSHDPLVYQMSSKDPQDYPLIQQLSDTNQLTETFSHMKRMSSIHNIVLYTGSDFLYSQQNKDVFSLESMADTNWYNILIKQNIPTKWFSPKELPKSFNTFSIMQVLYNPISISQPQAVLRIDISSQLIEQLMHATPVTKNGTTLLVNGKDVLLSTGNISKDEIDGLFPILSQSHQDTWIDRDINNTKSYMSYRRLDSTQWDLVTIIPYDDIYSVSHSLQRDMILIVILLALISYTIAFLVSQSSIKRISRLSHIMREVENGNVVARVEPEGKDEIGHLMFCFSNMMSKIETLMEEKITYGRELKNLELKALQAQINPHFLYNSLDLINCTAIKNHVPEISQTVNALAKFYKLSLSKGSEVITLYDELTHAKLYINIQNMRFENRIHVTWDIDESVYSCMVIKIILQPIIENAIIHGIFERQDKTGNLYISAKCVNEDILIYIQDNGVGMDKDTLIANFGLAESISERPSTTGYGVHNINERLRIAYGENYGLSCESTLFEGTTVTVRIPAIKNIKEDLS